MIGFPGTERSVDSFAFRSLLKDQGSAEMKFPAEYMFRHLPGTIEKEMDPIEATLAEMDRHGVEIGLIGCEGISARALKEYPERFVGSANVDPNDVTGSVRKIR